MTRRDNDLRIRPGRIRDGGRTSKQPTRFVNEVMRAARKSGHAGYRIGADSTRPGNATFGRGRFARTAKGLTRTSRRVVVKARVVRQVPICSADEQSEIVRILDARLEAADALDAEIDAALTRADALRQSILKKAFSGQLVPQDPGDEPAATLLARIKADRAKAAKTSRKRQSLA